MLFSTFKIYSFFNYYYYCSEQLFMQMADILVNEGYAQLGYDLISLDDCWLADERDSQGRLQPDAERFPSGIKGLADYVSTNFYY